jgi:hypothetical protein
MAHRMYQRIGLIAGLLLGLASGGCASNGAGAIDLGGGGEGGPVIGDGSGLAGLTFPVNDTGQSGCYDNGSRTNCPPAGQAFFGQDAQHPGHRMAFRDNGDGTVTDLNTGLMWVKEQGSKMSWSAAMAGARSYRLAGHSNWRLPSIKEMYSLIHFDGGFTTSEADSRPYIDTRYFGFAYGDASQGERPIDTQYCTSTEYVGTTMGGQETVFGVNLADGRIKGYPKTHPTGGDKMFAVKYVRGNPGYGRNDFKSNGDGTISDRATGLLWQRADSGKTHDWQSALSYCQGLKLAGRSDWRLPDAKELQSIVDYTRAPAVTNSAAIDPLFRVTDKESFFWSSTTHLDGPTDRKGQAAVYVAFGRATGYMANPPGSGNLQLMDVHGAGAQRSDPKTGNPGDYPYGRGPQGDVIRIYNYVRCVCDIK